MKQSFIYLTISIILGGVVGLFAKWITLQADTIVFIRSGIAAVATAVYLAASRGFRSWPDRKSSLVLLLLGGLLGFHWVTYFHAIQVSTVAVGMISLFTYPVMIVLLEPLFSSTRLQLVDLLLGVTVFVGIIVLVPEFQLSNKLTLGVLWGLLSATLFSLRTIFSRKYVQQYDGPTVMVFQFAAAAAVTMPMFVMNRGAIGARNWVMLLILGLVFTGFSHIMVMMSLEKLPAKSFGIISAVQPFLGTIVAAIFLNEIPTVRTVLGGLIIIGAAVIESYRSLKASDEV